MIDLDQLDALMKAATPGEWYWSDEQLLPIAKQWTLSPGIAIIDGNGCTPDGDARDRANSACIIALHNAAPELIRLARLGRMVEAAKGDE